MAYSATGSLSRWFSSVLDSLVGVLLIARRS